MKSKIPWSPGPAPLMKLAQATGLCGGVLVPSGLKPPPALSLLRLGSSPSLIIRSQSRGSMPSMPMTITFLPALRGVPPSAEPVIAGAQRRGAGGHGGRALEDRPSIHAGVRCIRHQAISARVGSGWVLVFAPASPTAQALPSM